LLPVVTGGVDVALRGLLLRYSTKVAETMAHLAF
jgi:hypothetical protein